MSGLSRDELEAITGTTLDHYESNADGFWEATRDHDVDQNVNALLTALPEVESPRVLDFGCGPGRDLCVFRDRGCEAVGLEGSPSFAHMAREHSGCEVIEQNFLFLDLPGARFHGVFANASLFHVPRQELARVLRELYAAIIPGGALFCSNPRGRGDEGWSGKRYGVWHEEEAWTANVTAAGFTLIERYYRPAGLPRDQQPWFATVWRRS